MWKKKHLTTKVYSSWCNRTNLWMYSPELQGMSVSKANSKKSQNDLVSIVPFARVCLLLKRSAMSNNQASRPSRGGKAVCIGPRLVTLFCSWSELAEGVVNSESVIRVLSTESRPHLIQSPPRLSARVRKRKGLQSTWRPSLLGSTSLYIHNNPHSPDECGRGDSRQFTAINWGKKKKNIIRLDL